MIVVDASAVLELVFATDIGRSVARRLGSPESLHAPQLIVIECLQVIQRAERRREIDADLAGSLVDDLMSLDIELYDHSLLAPRIWELRNNLTAYDAAYVALSELLDASLVTTDAKLAGAPGNAATIELVSAR